MLALLQVLHHQRHHYQNMNKCKYDFTALLCSVHEGTYQGEFYQPPYYSSDGGFIAAVQCCRFYDDLWALVESVKPFIRLCIL